MQIKVNYLSYYKFTDLNLLLNYPQANCKSSIHLIVMYENNQNVTNIT